MKYLIALGIFLLFVGSGCVRDLPVAVPTTPSIAELSTERGEIIRLETPRSGETVESPLTIRGEARGNWFFEASFPLTIVDWDGRIIGQGIAQAQGEWMTTEFVPFEATLTFTADPQAYSNRGALILRKDNPSGLPANDDSVEISVVIDNGAR